MPSTLEELTAAARQLANSQQAGLASGQAMQAANQQAALGQINNQQAAAAQALGLYPGYHMTKLDCMMGCEICGIALPPRLVLGGAGDGDFSPPKKLGNPFASGAGLAGARAPTETAAGAITNALAKLNEDMKKAATPRWLVPDVGVPSIFEYKATPPVPNDRASDQIGRHARASISDAVAGCRLGCSCKQHAPVKKQAYIPSIDDWDLLPDV